MAARPVGRLGRLVDSIKFRVVLSASLLFTLIAMAASLILIQAWAADLESRRPPQLAEAMEQLCAQVVSGGDPSAAAVDSPSPVAYTVETPNGSTLAGYLSHTAGTQASAPGQCDSGLGRWALSREGVPSDGKVQMTLGHSVRSGEGDWELRVTTTVGATPDDVSTMVRAARLVIPALVLCVAALLWLVTAEALRPVQSLIASSKEISLGTLDQRLSYPRHADEISDLTEHLNTMFDRLDAANERQQQFVSDASHELRSPVATILAVSERGKLDRDDAVLIHSEASRLSGLIDSLLELARVQEGAPLPREEMDLAPMLLEDAERILAPAERRGVTVDTTGVQPLRLRASRSAVTGVVRNLVDNAVRHANTEVALVCRTEGDWAVLEVHDDGAGIPEDKREAVFERFVRLDQGRSRAVGGTGLGLALVKDLVEAHEGTVTSGASPMGGAVFTVRLPLHPGEDGSPGKSVTA